MLFFYRKSRASDVSNDIIYVKKAEILETMDEAAKEKEIIREQEDKLIFSYAMVRTVKLSQLETKVDVCVQNIKDVPHQLAMNGKLGLSTKKIHQQIGELLELKTVINVHSGIREEPDICWDKPELEQLYFRIAKNLSLIKRSQTLNNKLDYLQQITQILQAQAYNAHSGNLEKIIILLIAVEIFFEVEGRGFFLGLYFPYQRMSDQE